MNLSELANDIVQYIQNEFPEFVVGEKYGGIVFTLKDSKQLIGGVFTYKKHVGIEFSFGYLLHDPDNKLQGSGKFRRHLRAQNQQDINKEFIHKLFAESLLLAIEG